MPALSHLASAPEFRSVDPHAIAPQKSVIYALRTADQEQGSMSGNLAVLKEIRAQLGLDDTWYDNNMLYAAGDQLTLSRLTSLVALLRQDSSSSRSDTLESVVGMPGLFHLSFNTIKIIKKAFWGDLSDPTSLASLAKLTGRTDVASSSFLYYPWSRFLRLVFTADCLSAATTLSDYDSIEAFEASTATLTADDLLKIAEGIVDSFMGPGQQRLEDDGIKGVRGGSVCGNTIERMKSLGTLLLFDKAVSDGHPAHILALLRLLLPLFAATGAHLYTHLLINFLISLDFETPPEAVILRVRNLVVNPSGKSHSFVPLDLHTEHLNANIKSHAGSNLSPELLATITPAASPLRHFADQLEADLASKPRNTAHSTPSQADDIDKAAHQLFRARAHNYRLDRPLAKGAPDLVSVGRERLAGRGGAVARALLSHAQGLEGVRQCPEGVPGAQEWRQANTAFDEDFDADAALFEDVGSMVESSLGI
ncbi:hypothetical protein JCM5296_002075 [Sporobolomyces johnsonii]